jgi:hypothetical protein
MGKCDGERGKSKRNNELHQRYEFELSKMAAAAECGHVAFLLELARIEAAATADITEDQTAAFPLAEMQ